MRSIAFVLLMTLSLGNLYAKKSTGEVLATAENQYKMPTQYYEQAIKLYDSMKLGKVGLEKEIFIKAYKGYIYLLGTGMVKNTRMLSIADFSQSSRNKRLYIIDLTKVKLVMNTFVSHGKNSGYDMATSFSNLKDSYKSTLGFLVTSDTYTGSAGYSLRFQGMEPGINDMVRNRDIIVHGSKFVNAQYAAGAGRVGNSLGCPAVPEAQCKKIIDLIKGGSVYFIYHPDEFYQASSPILNATVGNTAFFFPRPIEMPSDSGFHKM